MHIGKSQSMMACNLQLQCDFGTCLGHVNPPLHGAMAVAGESGSAVWSFRSDLQASTCGTSSRDTKATKVC